MCLASAVWMRGTPANVVHPCGARGDAAEVCCIALEQGTKSADLPLPEEASFLLVQDFFFHVAEHTSGVRMSVEEGTAN